MLKIEIKTIILLPKTLKFKYINNIKLIKKQIQNDINVNIVFKILFEHIVIHYFDKF